MNTNFQPLTEQQCKEINGGTNVNLNLLGLNIILGLPDLTGIVTGLGNTLVGVSTLVSGLLVNLANAVGGLLGNIKI